MRLCTRSLSLLAAVGVAALALPAIMSAQAPDSSRGSVRVRVAGGIDLGVGDTYLAGGNALGILGLEWLHRRAPLAARLEFSYFAGREFSSAPPAPCDPECFLRRRSDQVGITLDGRYTFFARSPVRPFLVSGLGVYRTMTATTTNYAFDCTTTVPEPGCYLAAGPTRRSTYPSLGLGLHSGFGFAVPVRSSELSLEFRFRQMTSGPPSPWAVPILVGIRF